MNEHQILTELGFERQYIYGCQFETHYERLWHDSIKYILIAGICMLAILSTAVLVKWETWDIAERQTLQSIYHGNAKQVEENKAKAFKKWKIAGAGDNTRQSE